MEAGATSSPGLGVLQARSAKQARESSCGAHTLKGRRRKKAATWEGAESRGVAELAQGRVRVRRAMQNRQ